MDRFFFLELHEMALEPMILGQYGLRDPYCNADPSKIGTMRADEPWEGYCAPKMYQDRDNLFYIVQWRLDIPTNTFM